MLTLRLPQRLLTPPATLSGIMQTDDSQLLEERVFHYLHTEEVVAALRRKAEALQIEESFQVILDGVRKEIKCFQRVPPCSFFDYRQMIRP